MRVRRRLPMQTAAALAAGVGLLAGGCGPPLALQARSIEMPLPILPTPLGRIVEIPARPNYAPVPLVVIVDDGPPVDPDRTRRQARHIDAIERQLVADGYAVWRPLRNAWPENAYVVRCVDELAAQVDLGLGSVRQIAAIDSNRVILLGFGAGGIVSVMATQRMPNDVYALGLVGTPARSIDRVVVSSSLRDSVATARLRKTFDKLWAGAYPDSAHVLSGTAGCWRAWLTITRDVTDVVASLPQPVLVVQGTADELLPLLDMERFRRVIAHRPMSAVEPAVGVKHDLSDAVPDPKQPPNILSPRVMPIIMYWLHNVAPSPAARPARNG